MLLFYFKCNITPSRQRAENKRNEDRKPTIVDWRPFSGKSIVNFEDVPISKQARRLITIVNPFDEVLKVSVTKVPKPEFNVTLEWTINKIPPQSQLNLEVVWSPLKIVSCREVIQISDDNGSKKDVSVILKSCELKKAGRKVTSMGYSKRLKLKTPSPPRNFSRPSICSKVSSSPYAQRDYLEAQPSRQALAVSPLRNTTNVRMQQDIFDRISFSTCMSFRYDKENSAPDTPKNASALFDHIRFTPLTETRPKNESKLDYLASLPTPIGTKREDILIDDIRIRRNLMESEMSPEVIAQETPKFRPQCLPVVPEIEVTRCRREFGFDRTEIITERSTDEIDEIEIVLNDHRSVLGQTQILSPLCVISEDAQLVTHTQFQKTFEVNHSRSLIELTKADSPPRAMSESMCDRPTEEVPKLKANPSSMPNLNEINVGPIESNRYFHQQNQELIQQNLSIESIVSNADFRETEMCAQSSRLYLNELESPSKPLLETPFKSKPKNVMFEVSPGRKFHQSPIHSSPTMRRIQKEPELKRSAKKSATKMIFSPPRSQLSVDVREMQRRETFNVQSGGRSIRATTWKQLQNNQQLFAVPKVPRELILRPSLATQSLSSLSSSSLASASSTCSMPATLTKGRLYNENHINAYNRKDPFSATTTNDPFLSSTMYLDEETLDHIEGTYKKWLNALVTIPADLETTQNEKIDFGKLFNEVQTKELTLAQSKEVVCSKYYTSRLDSLRSSAVKFFHSEAVSTPLNKVTIMINDKNKLDIKTDRHIHLDLVLQRSLLELLLCYNPLWLRIGLEVIFNVQLDLESNRDIFGMSRFIITNLFKSPYLAKKYSKYNQQKDYLEKLRRFTAKNFLFIIFFLDRAKENRLIKKNPCLFMKTAPYKESAEILKKFASIILANYGDIIRALRRFDFIVTHKQTVIDEFDYAFKNLAIDLRDGVRLTKVMEIILMREDLVQKVRVPGD